MDKWTHKFKKRQTANQPGTDPTKVVSAKDETRIDQNNTDISLASIEMLPKQESVETDKKISGLFSKRRLTKAWGWAIFVSFSFLLLVGSTYSNNHHYYNSYPDVKIEAIMLEVLLALMPVFLIVSMFVWLFAKSKNVEVLIRQFDDGLYFRACGSLFYARYQKIVSLSAYQLTESGKSKELNFLVLEIETENYTYALGQPISEESSFGLESNSGMGFEIQLLSVEKDTVFDMANFLGLIKAYKD